MPPVMRSQWKARGRWEPSAIAGHAGHSHRRCRYLPRSHASARDTGPVPLLLKLGVLRPDLVALSCAHKSQHTLAFENGGFDLMTNPMLERLIATYPIDPLREPCWDAQMSL